MSRSFTISDIKNSACAKLNEHLFSDTQMSDTKKRSKFGNKGTEVDGEVFHSKKEAKRYKELRLLLKQGIIGFLARQVQYELNEGGTHSLIYIADFVYVDKATGQTIVEDVKGFRTRDYKKKKRLMKKIHSIEIIEV